MLVLWAERSALIALEWLTPAAYATVLGRFWIAAVHPFHLAIAPAMATNLTLWEPAEAAVQQT